MTIGHSNVSQLIRISEIESGNSSFVMGSSPIPESSGCIRGFMSIFHSTGLEVERLGLRTRLSGSSSSSASCSAVRVLELVLTPLRFRNDLLPSGFGGGVLGPEVDEVEAVEVEADDGTAAGDIVEDLDGSETASDVGSGGVKGRIVSDGAKATRL